LASFDPSSRRLGRAAALACAAACSLVLALPASGQAATHGLITGFTDFDAFQGGAPADRVIGFQHAKAAGATIVRLSWSWAGTAPNKPASIAQTRDPAWSGYQWSFLDEVAREATAAGLTPLFEITGAPDWAEGANKPSNVPDGTWKPSAAAFGAFAEAIARRFSGSYPDPDNPGRSLPRVRYWQGWNEPNLTTYLSPQWVHSGGSLVAESPRLYRSLINAWYKGIKKVSKSNVVITAGTSPFGDLQKGGLRMPPALFVRELFCLRGRTALKHFRCSGTPVHFDVLAHHPYPIGPPRRHAPNLDDVSIPDLSRLTRPLRAAQKAHTVTGGHKQLWATEFSWESSPPDPQGIPANLEATYLEGALSELWQEGVSMAGWYNMRDEAKGQGYPFTFQSGIFFRGSSIADDTPKPSYTAFSFPFTAYIHRGRAQLWGRAPAPGAVTIQKQTGNTWTTIAPLSARSSDRMFLGRASLPSGTNVRAVQGTRTSLTWRVFNPK
jgi:hypothetical protein